MKKRPLQEIQDAYENKGFAGRNLQKALKKDRSWKKLVEKRREKIKHAFPLTKTEERKYIMSTGRDYLIFLKIKQLEKMKLTKGEKTQVNLIRTQLEYDWRRQLIRYLNRMIKQKKREKT
jgi:hypothetical protein